MPPLTVRGSVRAIAVAALPAADPHTNRSHHYWIDAGALVRDGVHAPVRLGAVLGAARFWVGDEWGIGFYRAGRLTVGFAFDAERPGLNDQVALPPMVGNLVSCHGVVGDDLGWLFILEQARGRRRWHCVVVDRAGKVVADDETADEPGCWQACVGGGVAVARSLFVPTDDGIVRVEIESGVPSVTRRFSDTAAFVDSSVRLAVADGALIASGADSAVRMTID